MMHGARTLHRRNRPPRAAGFSLVELLIVLVIMGIIALFAYPSYTQHTIKANRAEAKAALLRIAQRQERFKTEHLRYARDLAELREADRTEPSRNGEAHYTLTLSATETTFTATASPNSAAQKRDAECTSFSINESGVQRADGAAGPEVASAKCWH